MEVIEMQKCINAESFLEILDTCIETLNVLRERVRKEIYYVELQ